MLFDSAYFKQKYFPKNPQDLNLDLNLDISTEKGRKNNQHLHSQIIRRFEKTQKCATTAGVIGGILAIGGIAVRIAGFLHPSHFGALTSTAHQWGMWTLSGGALVLGAITISLARLKHKKAIEIRDCEMEGWATIKNQQTQKVVPNEDGGK